VTLFWMFSRQNFYKQSAYRLNFWLEMAGMVLELYVVYTLWNVLFEQAPGSFGGVTLTQMLTYAVLGILLRTILATSEHTVNTYIPTQVRMGLITADLMKPVDFMLHMMARDFGVVVVRTLFFLLPPLFIANLVLDLVIPSTLLQIGAFLLAVVQAWVILFFCNFLFALISFKTLDLLGFMFTYFALMRFASGQIIPLWMYPDVLQGAIQALPFQSIFYTPMAIYTDVIPAEQYGSVLLVQAAWIVGLFLLSRLIWGRIHRTLVVQGG